jgi:hypothetical protein
MRSLSPSVSFALVRLTSSFDSFYSAMTQAMIHEDEQTRQQLITLCQRLLASTERILSLIQLPKNESSR